ncbi:T9SS type A sorting domain-containing protein [Algoriphagus algorifonticola]|uniref:T9SS type A sorting domain-containing protein n=1 Tax=Algoriphagus algorifonticola TaxID=2593007 RepID=UPI0011A133D2|nr:T9SS type A sorting domain-containing protein [Algoriphagus algorifonticola]
MKKLLLLLLSIVPIITYAQGEALIVSSSNISFDSAATFTVSQMLEANPNDTTEGGDLRAFNRWVSFYRNRVPLNAPANVNIMEELSSALFYYMNNLDAYCNSDPNMYTGDWSLLGPNNNYYGVLERQGRIDAVWVDPNDMGYILAGSNMGGLWKSTDTGHTWVNITDPSPTNNSVIPGTMGATRIAVNPLGRDTIYISLGIMGTLRKHGGYAMGLMYTHDGGQTWQVDANFLNANQQSDIAYYEKWVRQVKYMPGTGELFAISNNKVLHKPTGISGWYDITPSGLRSGCLFTDIEFSKQSPGKIIVSTDAKDDTCSLWVINSTDQSPQWQELKITMPAPSVQLDGDMIVDLSISATDIAYLNIERRRSSTNKTLVMALATTPINTVNLNIINNEFNLISVNPFTGDTSRVPFEFIEVSEANDDVIYAANHDGFNSFYRSVTGGTFNSFTSIRGATHADGRCIFIYHADTAANGINDIIFGGSDGGVVMKRSGNTNFGSITGSGLAVTQLYGLSNTEAHEGLVIGGAQDNGAVTYIRDRAIPWAASVVGGDNFMTKFANGSVTHAYTEGNPYDDIYRVEFYPGTNSTSGGIGEGNPTDFGNPTCEYCPQNTVQRPLYFDPDNEAFAGYRQVWTKPLGSGTWGEAFASFPRLDKTRSFAISEPNKDTVYIAFEDGADGDPSPPNGNSIGKLFRSVDAHLAPPNGVPTWQNITPSHVQWSGITSIVTDPRTMKRLWISLGNVNYGTTSYSPANSAHRVLYNGNYGDANSWVDISRGLPPVPVNKLLYLEGSDDILFAGTDAGVFRWNKTDSTWYCFNTGLPPVVVNDMEFNYCAGKLRIATFGRGVWETPAFDNSYVSSPSNIITSNTTWVSTRYLKSGIKVANGATLTIQNTGQDQTVIFMPKNASIIVEPGAQLVVNGARLTNGCEDCMWNGIRIVGQTNQMQTTTNQDKVSLLNGTIIEHARIAVANYGPTTATNTNTGGIIVAAKTTFLNNACAVSLQRYVHQSWNSWSALLKNYQASFSECDFIINDDFKGGTTDRFLTHVAMNEVDGVRFSACGFYNRNTSTLYSNEGDGIRAGNSGFRLTSVCTGLTFPCSSFKRNQFTGLRTGVWTQHDQMRAMYGVSVDMSNFDSCTVGIHSKGQHLMTAIRDSFRLGYGKTTFLDDFDCHKNIGIWTEHSYYPHIEDNHFEGFTHGGQHMWHENIGTITDNSQEYNKQIYRNTFLNLGKACFARGVNRDPFTYGANIPTGLRYYCNTFNNNAFDIAVSKMSMHPSTTVQSIAYNQGSSGQSAGNEFLDRISVNHLINSGNGLFSYYQTTGNYVPIANPNWPYNFWAPISTSNAHSCFPTGVVPTEGGVGNNFPVSNSHLNDIKASFRIAKDNKETLAGTLASLMDGGDTDALLSYISSSTQADTPALRTTLLSYSPYLTAEALTAVADVNILPQENLIQVLEANPEMLLNEELLEHLEYNIPNPLSGAQITQLRTASETTTARSETHAELGDYAMHMDWYGNMVLMHYLFDTTSDDRDSIPVWLDNINTVRAMYLKAAFYTSEGDYTTAQEILGNIQETFELDTEESDEHLLYMDVWDLVKSVYDDNRLLAQMDLSEIAELESIGSNPLSTARLIGTTVTVLLDEPQPQFRLPCTIMYEEPGSKPGKRTDEQELAKKKYHKQMAAGKNNMIKAYPNPAKDFVVFEYKLQEKSGNTLHITNTTGQKVKEIKLDNFSNKVEWETQSIPAGVYIYELKNGNMSIDVGRIVITK